MIESLIVVAVQLLILGIVAWLILWALGQLPVAAPLNQIVRTIVIVIFVLVAIMLLLRVVPLPAGL